MRLHGDVRLHLRAVLPFDDDIGFCKSTNDVAAHVLCWSAQIALLRQSLHRPAAAGCRFLLGRPREDRGRIRLHRLLESRDVRQALVLDTHQTCSLARSARGFRSHACNGLTHIPHDRIALVSLDARIAQLRRHHHTIQDMDSAHARVTFRRGRIDRFDASVSNGADDAASMEHARQLYVKGVASAPRHLLHRIQTRRRLADHVQSGVLRQRRRLIDRHAARDGRQLLANDAAEHRLLLVLRRAHVRVIPLVLSALILRLRISAAAASAALNTLG